MARLDWRVAECLWCMDLNISLKRTGEVLLELSSFLGDRCSVCAEKSPELGDIGREAVSLARVPAVSHGSFRGRYQHSLPKAKQQSETEKGRAPASTVATHIHNLVHLFFFQCLFPKLSKTLKCPMMFCSHFCEQNNIGHFFLSRNAEKRVTR